MSTDNQETPIKWRFFSVDRIVGIVIACTGVWLLQYGIEAGVEGTDLTFPGPLLFPQLAAWIFIVGGVIQAIRAKPGRELPNRREVFRYIMVSALIVVMALLMNNFGYLVGGVGLLAVMMFVVYEKRWLWIGVTVVAVPLSIWAFFVLLLGRVLP